VTYLDSSFTPLETQASNLDWVYLFQGGVLDNDNLYWFEHRDENPATGNWDEQDPAGARYVDGANLYQAFDSTPVKKTDSSGMIPGGAGMLHPKGGTGDKETTRNCLLTLGGLVAVPTIIVLGPIVLPPLIGGTAPIRISKMLDCGDYDQPGDYPKPPDYIPPSMKFPPPSPDEPRWPFGPGGGPPPPSPNNN